METSTSPSLGSATPAAPTGRRIWRTWLSRMAVALAGVGVMALVVMASAQPPPVVDVAAARRGLLEVVVEEDGVTRVHDRYMVGAPLTGNLGRMELHPGDAVQKGQLVARMVPLEPPLLDARTRSELESRVSAAQAGQQQAAAGTGRARLAVEYAQKELDRQRTLLAQKLTPPATLERAEFEVRSREMELKSAEFAARIADHDVEMARAAVRRLGSPRKTSEELGLTSPITGVVLRMLNVGGGVVAVGAPLLEVGDPAALEVVVDLLTQDAVRVKPGMTALLTRWGGEKPLRAHVRVVEPSAFSAVSALGVAEQRVNVVLDLDEPREQWATLGDGFRVEARIITDAVDNAVVVPAGAVFRAAQGWSAWRLNAQNVVEEARVELGRRGGAEVEVLNGLAAGDRVVVFPSDRVAAGVRVRVRAS